MPSRRHRPIAALVVLASVAGCRSSDAPTAPALADLLDHAAVVPSTPPYIGGPILERGNRLGDGPSILVADGPRAGGDDRRAHVVLGRAASIVWRTGRRGALEDLSPGRVVTVWSGPVELRSNPPVVEGRVIVIER